MQPTSPEAAFETYRTSGDRAALTEFHDCVAPYLIRLARSWTRHEADALDAVQATLLGVIKEPGTWDEGRPIRPWLAGALRNRCTRLYREETRTLPGSDLPQRRVEEPDEAAILLELRTTLDDLIRGLPPSLERTVSEHFVLGKPALRISREEGVHPNTVYLRIKQARHILQGQLSRMGLVLLAFFGLGKRARGAAPLKGSSSGLPALVGLVPVLMLVAVGAVILGWFETRAMPASKGGELVEAAAVDVAAPGAAAVVPGSVALGREDLRAGLAADEEPPAVEREIAGTGAGIAALVGGSLSGVVVNAGGGPLSGADVFVYDNIDGSGSPAHTTRTNDAGAFEVHGVGEFFSLGANARDLVCMRGLRGRLEKGASLSGFRVLMCRPTILEGTVLAWNGEPMAGAAVTVAPHYQRERSVDQSLHANVSWRYWGQGTTVTDQAGRFRLPGLPRGEPELVVMGTGHLLSEASVSLPSSPVEVRLVHASRLAGRVLGMTGAPLAGAKVKVVPRMASLQWTASSAETNANGEFEILGLPRPGDWIQLRGPRPYVVVSAPGFGTTSVGLKGLRADQPGAVSLYLAPEHVIRGELQDVGGLELSQYTIQSQGANGMEGGEARSDKAGAFELRGPTAGEKTLRIYPPGASQIYHERTIGTSSDTQRIVIEPSALRAVRFRFALRDAVTGHPIERPEVTLHGEGTVRELEWIPTGSGLELLGASPGMWAIALEVAGYFPMTLPARTFAPGMHDLPARLSPVRQLRLQATVPAGSETTGISVRGWSGSGVPIKFTFGLGGESMQFSTSDGDALLNGLPAEPVVLQVGSAKFQQTVRVDLTNAVTSTLQVRLDAKAPVPWPIAFVEEVVGAAPFGTTATFAAIHAGLSPFRQEKFRKRYAARPLRPATGSFDVTIKPHSGDRSVQFRLTSDSHGTLSVRQELPVSSSRVRVAGATGSTQGRASIVNAPLLPDFHSLSVKSATHMTKPVRIYNYHPVEMTLPIIVVLQPMASTAPGAPR